MRFVRSDTEVLLTLADLRVAGIEQLAIVLDRNAHALQRRLRKLEQGGLVEVLARAITPRRGRPEHLLALTKAGRDALGETGPERSLDAKVHKEVRYVEHQLVVTELRVQLVQLQRFLPEFQAQYLAPNLVAPGDDEVSARLGGMGSVPSKSHARPAAFIPDGVFALAHRELGKTLLFLVEADRGNEPLTSSDAQRPYLQSKIAMYREYLVTERYKHFERVVNAPLKGFRLLVVLAGRARITSLAALVRAEQPADFVWLTDIERLKAEGCWGPVWFAGGALDAPPQSILGSKMPQPCPTPRHVSGGPGPE